MSIVKPVSLLTGGEAPNPWGASTRSLDRESGDAWIVATEAVNSVAINGAVGTKSIACWMHFKSGASLSYWNRIIERMSGASNNWSWWWTYSNGLKAFYFHYRGPLNTQHTIQWPLEVPLGIWFHVVVSVNMAAPGTLKDRVRCIYQGIDLGDGVEIADGGETSFKGHSTASYIGSAWQNSDRVPCYMDEFQAWTVPLSEAQAAALMNGQIDPASPGLDIYYRFEPSDLSGTNWMRNVVSGVDSLYGSPRCALSTEVP